MKITVIIPSRGRVRRLAAALTSLHQLESGENQITYGIACDDDDPATRVFCLGLQTEMSVAVRTGPRPQSLGGLDNELAELIPADVYCVFADDLLCLTPGWDKKIAEAVKRTPHGVFWWKAYDGSLVTVPVVTEKWRSAAGGLFTDYFPFWYDDLWLCELWYMVTDQELLMLDIVAHDKPTDTIRMRELGFWHDFYNTMRGDRVEHAFEIAKKLGLPNPIMGPHLHERLKGQLVMTKEVEEDVHRRNKSQAGPADAAYQAARSRAESLMRTH